MCSLLPRLVTKLKQTTGLARLEIKRASIIQGRSTVARFLSRPVVIKEPALKNEELEVYNFIELKHRILLHSRTTYSEGQTPF